MAEIELKEEDIELTGKTLYMVEGQVEIELGRFKKNPEKLFVVKKIYPIDEDYDKMKREVVSLYKLNHPAIPKFYGYYWSRRNNLYLLCVLIEYFHNGDLAREILRRKNNTWSEEELLHHFGCLLDAFAYMECAGFAHRDIKPQNIFIGNEGSFKVGDFGCSIQSLEHQLRELATISGSPIYLSPLVREAWISYQEGSNWAGKTNHNVYKSDVYSLGLTFLYMATLKEPIELVSLKNLKEKIKGKLYQIRYNRIIPLLELMLKVNEDERPNFIQLKHFYNENFRFLDVNVFAQARFLAEMVNERVFSPTNFNLLYLKGTKITFKIKTKNIKLLANLYSKCSNERLTTVEKEILLDLIKNDEISDNLCKICNNRIFIDDHPLVKSKCPCRYWMHKACYYESLNTNKALTCNICNNSLVPFINQIFCPNHDCPGTIPLKAKTFKCNICFAEFCKICKINLINHQNSCISSSLSRRSLRCGKCGQAVIRERGSFYYKCQNCGYLCIVCFKGIYASHKECCSYFISLNQF
ncbi:unnamed protein product [Blepharisma stoltei]|uniref:Protein kinase domain-containing protein n=1 Tax=Blepharisma stoltei TaxID=1481888 RepID=A0AAU9KCJ5_9CILI|nr:unnamed protein product [Blepharisma stoltei]